jgi:hypothetical protein
MPLNLLLMIFNSMVISLKKKHKLIQHYQMSIYLTSQRLQSKKARHMKHWQCKIQSISYFLEHDSHAREHLISLCVEA